MSHEIILLVTIENRNWNFVNYYLSTVLRHFLSAFSVEWCHSTIWNEIKFVRISSVQYSFNKWSVVTLCCDKLRLLREVHRLCDIPEREWRNFSKRSCLCVTRWKCAERVTDECFSGNIPKKLSAAQLATFYWTILLPNARINLFVFCWDEMRSFLRRCKFNFFSSPDSQLIKASLWSNFLLHIAPHIFPKLNLFFHSIYLYSRFYHCILSPCDRACEKYLEAISWITMRSIFRKRH